MYADFLFFDHFLVVDFLSSFLWRLTCGRVFHILKVAFQYEYMMIGSPLNPDLVEIPSIIDWPVMESVLLHLSSWLCWKRHHLIGCQEPNLLYVLGIQIS